MQEQLICDRYFGAGVPILHMHAGWLRLPWATTVYYRWLEGEETVAGVGAILLDHLLNYRPDYVVFLSPST